MLAIEPSWFTNAFYLVANDFSWVTWAFFWHMMLASLFGVMVGAAEILSRYKDEPFLAMLTHPGLSYLGMNGIISGAAFCLLENYKATIFPTMANDLLLSSIVAGFGAMAVMRSKLFSFKTERGEEFAVGPDAVITTFLKSVDRKIDRTRSAQRQRIVVEQISKIKDPTNKASDFLIRSLASYQNLSSEEKSVIYAAIKDLSSQNLDPQVLLMAIGYGFLNLTGQSNFSLLMEQLRIYLESLQVVPPK